MSGGKELSKSSTRYCRDINTKMFLAHLDNEWNPKQLFIRSDWEPETATIPAKFRARLSFFLKTLASSFQR
jgi:hypothetical protein